MLFALGISLACENALEKVHLHEGMVKRIQFNQVQQKAVKTRLQQRPTAQPEKQSIEKHFTSVRCSWISYKAVKVRLSI